MGKAMFNSKIVKFIRSDLDLRGHTVREKESGGVGRRITQFYSEDGILIFEYDPYTKESKVFREDLL